MNDNPYLKRLDELEKARKLWQESEWRLNFLRTQTGTPPPEPTEQEILQWYQQYPTEHDFQPEVAKPSLQLKKLEPDLWPLSEYAVNLTTTTPSEWFSEKFPEQAKIHGCPFIESVEDVGDGLKKINPLAPNIDFLAAILGGDEKMGHKVIYFESEMQFYYRDRTASSNPPATKSWETCFVPS